MDGGTRRWKHKRWERHTLPEEKDANGTGRIGGNWALLYGQDWERVKAWYWLRLWSISCYGCTSSNFLVDPLTKS